MGVSVNFKLCFNTHINVVLEKLGKQSEVVSKVLICVLRSQLILFYKTNIQPTIQYGVLIYDCYSYPSLLPIVNLHRKIIRPIKFKKKSSGVEDERMMCSSLSLYQLHECEFPNFILKSNNNMHSEKYLNNLFVFFSNSSRNTRSFENLLKNNARKVNKIQRYSIHSRCVKLFHTLQHINSFNKDVCS